MTDLLVIWGPVLVILALLLFVGRRQMKTYYAHVDEVNRANRELVDVTREVVALSRQNLAALQEIKSLLESRKA